MKILEWNINQRCTHINTKKIPDFIAQAVLDEDPDFFVLTEAYKVQFWAEFINKFPNYYLFSTDNSPQHQNEVVIGVRNDHQGARLVESMDSGFANLNPNFLHVAITINERDLHIMGVRVRVPKLTPASIESQTYRLNQLDILLDHIESVEEPIVLVGDFNNYRRGLSPATLDMKRDPKYSKCALWNMMVLQERFHELGYSMHTPHGFSWGWENPNENYQVAQDHVFLKGLEMAINQDGSEYCYYTDEFKELHPEVYKKKGIRNVIPPYPDHKMLVVEFDLMDLI